jgi:hypothetical protein
MKPLAFSFQSLLRLAHLTRPSQNLGVSVLESDLLTLKQIAKKYQRQPRTFKKHADELGVPRQTVGRDTLWDPAVVAAYFATRPIPKKEMQLNVVAFKAPKRRNKIAGGKFAEALR